VIVTGLVPAPRVIEAGGIGLAAHVEAPVFADHLLEVVRAHARRRTSPGTSDGAASTSGTNPQTIRVVRVIEERFAEADLSIRSVAHDLGVSTEHLCRLLKRHTGTTFVAILRRTRVRAARQLLQSTTLSMKQIADRVGFRSASRFDHDFRKICGVSPTEHRIAGLRSLNASRQREDGGPLHRRTTNGS
jgi:transcriptional regulator GlxA family with amidase domain